MIALTRTKLRRHHGICPQKYRNLLSLVDNILDIWIQNQDLEVECHFPKPTKLPIRSKTHLSDSPLSGNCTLFWSFQNYTLSDYWALLRFWNNGHSEQWGVPDLESESSKSKFAWIKSPKLRRAAFHLLAIMSLYRLNVQAMNWDMS